MNPELHFHGAAHGVTGSCFLIKLAGKQFLVDCGLFQGSNSERELNARDFPFTPSTIDAVILTHAHIDHSGLLPKLVKDGFTGPIYATEATIDLCSVMLPDSGYIQEAEADRRSRRGKRSGRSDVVPIYTAADATACLVRFRPIAYEEWLEVVLGARARFWNAGHMLGSASIELELGAGQGNIRILFSGDIGPAGKLLQPDPLAPSGFDYVVCESTYGAKDRPETTLQGRREVLCAEVLDAVRRGGALLIPSFAVERAQEVLVDLFWLIEQSRLPAGSASLGRGRASCRCRTRIRRPRSAAPDRHATSARRQNSPPPEKLALAARSNRTLRRFPSRRYVGPRDPRRCPFRSHSRRGHSGQSCHPQYRSLFGTRGRPGVARVDQTQAAGRTGCLPRAW